MIVRPLFFGHERTKQSGGLYLLAENELESSRREFISGALLITKGTVV